MSSAYAESETTLAVISGSNMPGVLLLGLSVDLSLSQSRIPEIGGFPDPKLYTILGDVP